MHRKCKAGKGLRTARGSLIWVESPSCAEGPPQKQNAIYVPLEPGLAQFPVKTSLLGEFFPLQLRKQNSLVTPKRENEER